MKNFIKTLALGAVMSRVLAFAAGPDASTILNRVGSLINQAIPILVLAGVAYFIWGVVRYVIAGDADKKEDARRVIIQGLIGLFVIVGMWGIVFVGIDSAGLTANSTLSGTPSVCVPGVTAAGC